jgi:hypothetical protein
MMTSTIKSALSVKVDQIHQQLLANTTIEAGRMPANIRPKSGSINRNVTVRHHIAALERQKMAFVSPKIRIHDESALVNQNVKGHPMESCKLRSLLIKIILHHCPILFRWAFH